MTLRCCFLLDADAKTSSSRAVYDTSSRGGCVTVDEEQQACRITDAREERSVDLRERRSQRNTGKISGAIIRGKSNHARTQARHQASPPLLYQNLVGCAELTSRQLIHRDEQVPGRHEMDERGRREDVVNARVAGFATHLKLESERSWRDFDMAQRQ